MSAWDPHVLPPGRLRRRRALYSSPPTILGASFILLIAVGTLLLKLPWAATRSVGWLDAVFTATSAVTVTGLVVVDTATAYTLFGQIVILILIQLGGIGLMTFAVLAILLLGKRVSLRHQLVAREALNQTTLQKVAQIARAVVVYTLMIEAVGLVLLAIAWVPEKGWAQGLYHAAFYTISAFNNAGFALAADNLIAYAGHVSINLIITALFIVGGLGFAVLADLLEKRRFKTLTVHSKLMIVGTLAINLLVMWMVFFLEYGNPATLGGLDSLGEKLLAAWFQAVTPRTAGFNTLDIASMTDSTALLMLLLMFIGAGPNSTASGIKLSTFIILLLAARAFLLRRERVVVFGRTIAGDAVAKALAVTLIAMLCVFATIFLLTVTEQADFLAIAFEVVSAYGTVGLSRGLTDDLSIAGRSIIILAMFVGRIGPLTLGFMLATPRIQRIRFAVTDVQIG